jgi:hypothetical protein
MKDSTLSIGRAENMIRRMTEDLKKGVIPTVDFGSISHFDLGALAYLVSFVFAARQGMLISSRSIPPLSMILPQDPMARDFLFKIGLFNFIHRNQGTGDEIIRGSILLARTENDVNRARKWDNRFPYMPFCPVVKRRAEYSSLSAFELNCRQFLEGLRKTFYIALVQHLEFDEEKADDFWVPNKELVENIFMHSDSWGLGAIQCLKDSVVICYADIGRGMLESLEKRKEEILNELSGIWNDELAIRGAFIRGMTSVAGESRGTGLNEMQKYVFDCHGNFECRSGAAKVLFFSETNTKGFTVERVPGVQIRIWLPAK